MLRSTRRVVLYALLLGTPGCDEGGRERSDGQVLDSPGSGSERSLPDGRRRSQAGRTRRRPGGAA